MNAELDWLPATDEVWDVRLAEAKAVPWPASAPLFIQLAKFRLDFAQTIKLDRALSRSRRAVERAGPAPFRLAILGSSTLDHLLPGIRLAGLRRGLIVDCYVGPYGTYLQQLAEGDSELYSFAPHAVLLALDSRHLIGDSGAHVEQTVARLKHCWSLAQTKLNCAVIQQTALPIFTPAIGGNEHRLPASPFSLVERLNALLRPAAETADVSLLSVDAFTRWHGGLDAWYEPTMWHLAKQEIAPRVSHLYGEQVGRLLGAMRGLTAKCLVLDLDNTLWGGVIGDDGIDGIILGHGSALGESFVEFQKFAKGLLAQGVILAVCSKNDEANALLPFESHPEMVLKREDIACFVANWTNKAQNIKEIAKRLNIGLDALVFVDDNPAERGLIRRELPMVAVPELPEDPGYYTRCVARAGYFDTLTITDEDRERSALYAANATRDEALGKAVDIESYLAALEMELIWRPFDRVGLPRIVQLANKTNQFNLTTRRYVEREIEVVMCDPRALTLQLRLKDTYGDNGVIGLLIGRLSDGDLAVETWLMSCRVLGRKVEEATLNLLVERARAMGARRIIGEYRPSAKNSMVQEHYARLGFVPLAVEAPDVPGTSRWTIVLDDYQSKPTPIKLIGGQDESESNIH